MLLLPFWVTNSRPSGAMAMAVGLGTWATSELVKPCGTVAALRAGSVFHHSSAAIAAARVAATAAIATTRTLKLPALTIILPLGERAGFVSPAELTNEGSLLLPEEDVCATNHKVSAEELPRTPFWRSSHSGYSPKLQVTYAVTSHLCT